MPESHGSPFMTRAKPNSDRRMAIIDLCWPLGEAVNAGTDKNVYLGRCFPLTFPTVDDITKCLGHGVLLYKVDISQEFPPCQGVPG